MKMKAPDITVCDKISDITGAAAVKAANQGLWINKRGINKRGKRGINWLTEEDKKCYIQ